MADRADPCHAARDPRGLRCCAPRAVPDPVCAGREVADHAAEPRAGRQIQLRRPAAGHGALPRAVRPVRPGRVQAVSATSLTSSGRSRRSRSSCSVSRRHSGRSPIFCPGTVLIVGAARPASAAPTPGMVRAYNSIYVIDHDGATLSVYDKLHLVPFGEYLPFQDFLERLGLMQLTKVKGGYLSGKERKPIPVPRAPAFLPLICYEIVFPGEAVPSGERPGLARQSYQRRVVRSELGALSASATGAGACDRGGPAAGTRRQYRRVRGDRSPWPVRPDAAARHRGRTRSRLAADRLRPTPYVRFRDGPAGLAMLLALALVLWRRRRTA